MAFIAVFVDHYGSDFLASLGWGWMGVDLFFVLSGFLITGILYDSLHRVDYFQRFYIRRTLRIFPLYYGFWIVLLLLTPLLHFQWNRYNLSSLLYLQNFFMPGATLLHHVQPSHVDIRMHHLLQLPPFIETTHLWSLCVEEHFYLVWPAIVVLLGSRRALLRFCLIAIPLFPIGRAIYIHFEPAMLGAGALYVNSFSRADTLLVGALLAVWLRGPHPSIANVRRLAIFCSVACPALLVALLAMERAPVGDGHVDPVVSTVGFTLIAFGCAGVLVLAIQPSSVLTRFLTLRPLVKLGRISYGMYFFHVFFRLPLARLLPRHAPHHEGYLMPPVSFLLTLGMATLSFRYVESPFLRLKDRIASGPGKGAKTVEALGLVSQGK